MTNEILNALIEATLASSCALAIVLVLRKPLRLQFGPALAYSSWLLVPVSIVATLLPAKTSVFLKIPIELPSLQLPTLTLPTGSEFLNVSNVNWGVDWTAWLLSVWGVGAVLAFIWLLRQQVRFVKSLGVMVETNGVFRAESTAGCPALVGIWRPKIVIPVDFETRYTSDEQALILAHEQMHLRRGDALANATCALMRCIFWFNPLLQIAASRFRFDQELACDAAVMRDHSKSRRSYADAMLKTQMVDAGLPVGCHWQSIHPLQERVMNLKQSLPRGVRRAAGQALMAALVCAVGYGAWAAQPPSAATVNGESGKNQPIQDSSGALAVAQTKLDAASKQVKQVMSRPEKGLAWAADVQQAHAAHLHAVQDTLDAAEKELASTSRQLELAQQDYEIGRISSRQLQQVQIANAYAEGAVYQTRLVLDASR